MKLLTALTRKQNDLGFNLIEASLVLGILGLIIGGIFAAWATVASQQRVRKAADMTTIIVGQIRTAYAARTTFDTTDTASGATFTQALVAANLIPVEYLVNGAVKNPWGGNVLITPDTSGMNVSYSSVNNADCKKLANMILGNARNQGLTKIDNATIDSTTNFSTISGSICTGTTGSTLSLYFLLKSN
jgi:type II secretory pathway pseudopilin PulG